MQKSTQEMSKVSEGISGRRAWLLENVLSASSDQFYLFDSEHILRFANKGAIDGFATSDGEIIGVKLHELALPREVMDEIQEALAEIAETHEKIEVVGSMMQAHGLRHIEYRFSPLLDSDDRYVGAVVNLRDITDRTLSKEAVRQFFSLSLDLLCIAGFDGYFKQMNPAWEELLGFTTAELLARPFIEFVHHEDRERTTAAAQKLAEGIPVVDFENRYLTSSGAWKWLAWKASMNVDDELIYATARDVTQQKVTEATLRTARIAAEKATEAKSAFLANMSHELRTPLNAIIGFSEMLGEQIFGDLNEKQSRYVENIRKSGHHLLELINDILQLSKIEAGRMDLEIEAVDVEEAVRDAIAIVSTLAERKALSLSASIEQPLPSIQADRGMVKQILYNLLSNAIKFTPEGGSIVVDAKIRARSQSSPIELSVKDSGYGIRVEHQKRIFQEFEQIDSAYNRQQQGTGLGLALTKKMVGMHAGSIWVESEGVEGKGSRFVVQLPVSREQDLGNGDKPESPPVRADQTSNERPARTSQQGQMKVLIVEDDPHSREILSEYMSGKGYTIFHALDGEQAISMANEFEPDLIILDILLPKKDGWQVLQELRAGNGTHHIPVILVTVTHTNRSSIRYEAVELLQKPVQKSRFLSLVDKFIGNQSSQSRTALLVCKQKSAEEMLVQEISSAGFVVRVVDGEQGEIELEEGLQPDIIVIELGMHNTTAHSIVEKCTKFVGGEKTPVILLSGDQDQDQFTSVLEHSVVIDMSSNSGKKQLVKILGTARAQS